MYRVLIFLLAIVFLGCNTEEKADKNTGQSAEQTEEASRAEQGQSEITETYWKLVTLQGEPVSIPEDQKEAHIMLKAEGQNLTGSGGCNVLNGTYKLNNSSISFSKMGTTMMSCPDMETEKQFLKVLGKVDSYGIKADSLMLNSDSDQPLAKFVSAEKREQ